MVPFSVIQLASVAVIVMAKAHAPNLLFYLNSLGMSARWLGDDLIIFAPNPLPR